MTSRWRWWWRVAGGRPSRWWHRRGRVNIQAVADELRLALVVALVVCASALLAYAAPVEPAVWSGHASRRAG